MTRKASASNAAAMEAKESSAAEASAARRASARSAHESRLGLLQRDYRAGDANVLVQPPRCTHRVRTVHIACRPASLLLAAICTLTPYHRSPLSSGGAPTLRLRRCCGCCCARPSARAGAAIGSKWPLDDGGNRLTMPPDHPEWPGARPHTRERSPVLSAAQEASRRPPQSALAMGYICIYV